MSSLPNQNTDGLIKANTNQLLNEVFCLRYRAYRAMEAIEANDDQQFSDEYDISSLSTSYLYVKNGAYIGSIRANLYSEENSWQAIPAFETFWDDVKQELGKEKTILESSRFVIDPLFQSSSNRYIFKLMEAIILNNKILRPDYIVTVVRLDHANFYKRIFNFKIISPLKVYSRLKATSAVLLATKGSCFEKITDESKIFKVKENQMHLSIDRGNLKIPR